jgi:hypothetical protein
MATSEKPPRSWDIDDLLDLGRRSGAKHLKAVPLLILENWVLGERQERTANYVRTNNLARRLVASNLVSGFKPRGTGSILGSLIKMQNGRNLTNPRLIRYQGARGLHWINLPHYEPLLQEYRQIYREHYPEDYAKLFPEGEPEWERPSLPKIRAEQQEAKPISSEPTVSLPASRILTAQQNLESLREDVGRLSAKIDTVVQQALSLLAEEAQQFSFVHTSPDFPNTAYGAKITSIEDAIRDMLKRAEHSIRVSTRQIDMFDDELIRLKQDNPHLEITVLSRGPERVEGPRRRIAGRAFERMGAVGIKLPIEQDLLHSRMVVVDEQEVLISSADLDYTQMEKEFNAGIWTNNPSVVAEAIRYFDNLLRSPTVKSPRQ